jgi:hypothetical protein
VSAEAISVFVHKDVKAVQELYATVLGAGSSERSCHQQVELLAERLALGHQAHHPGAYVELRNWFPDLGDKRETEVWDLSLELGDFRSAVSREHGYASAEEVDGDDRRPSVPYEAAIDAMLGGDIDLLETQLEQRPTLARATSHWPHRATLLHYATANGVETYRQVVPANLPDCVALLIEHGADVNAVAYAYGSGQRPLGLLLSSGHPHLAGVTGAVASLLRAEGAT